MKRQILTLIMALMAILTASAQKKMVVVIDGKPQTPIEVWRVDEIQFADDDKEVKLNDEPQKVNLGLSVQWADRNMGAANPQAPGRLIGWGDITLTNLSKKLQYFPVDGANKDIFGGDYDVAKKHWGEEWRMPSQKEMQELIELCEWTWNSEKNGYDIKHEGFEGSLFLPATGYREDYLEGGFEGELIEDAKGFYWTGSINADDYEQAQLLQFGDNKNLSIAGKERYVRMAIRPVCGPAVIPTSIENVEITDITDRLATVTVTLAGSLQDITLAGLAYGKDPDALSVSDTDIEGCNKVLDIGNPLKFSFVDLEYNTTYYVMAYLKTNEGKYLKNEIKSFTTKAEDKFPVAEAIDLGLPSKTKWASWNMGASSPKEVPTTKYARFGWGDPTGEVHDETDMSKYAVYQDEQLRNGKVIEIDGTQYDLARVKWGNEWQLPSTADFNELSNHCTWEWYEDGENCKGYKIISRINGNYIFLPAAGRKNTSLEISLNGIVPCYWTNKNASPSSAVMIRAGEGGAYEESKPFYCEASIRPVIKDNSNNDNPGEDPNEDPNNNSETIEVGTAVDLGLPSGTKWADRNIGAASANNTGEYICWGDTKQRDSYRITDYLYYDVDNGYNGFTYLGTSSSPEVEYTIGGTKYDAARERWGGNWRMPKRADVNELIDYCTWTWTSQSGVTGYEVKGPNNKTIFLPAAGRMTQTDTEPEVFELYTNGYYWTDHAYYGAVEDNFNTAARTLEFNENKDSRTAKNYKRRYMGLPIRPVQSK